MLDGRQRQPRGSAAAGAAAARRARQGQPDPVQRLGRRRASAGRRWRASWPSRRSCSTPASRRPCAGARARTSAPPAGSSRRPARRVSAPTVAFATLGCRLNQVDTQPAAGARSRRAASARCRSATRGRRRRRQHVHGDRARRALRPPGHPPRARALSPRRARGRDRLLGADEPGGGGGARRRRSGGRQRRQARGCPTCSTALLPRTARAPRIEVGDVRAARLDAGRAGWPRPTAARAPSSRSRTAASTAARSASCRSRAGASRSLEPGGGRGAGAPARRGRPPGDRADRRGPRSLRRRPHAAHRAWRRCCARLVAGARACAGSGCPRCCRRTSRRSCSRSLTTAPVDRAALPRAAAERQRPRAARACGGRTRSAMYRRVVERLAARDPGLGLGADVDRGLSRRDRRGLRGDARRSSTRCRSRYLHVFPYSARPGTEAAGLAGAASSRARSPTRARAAAPARRPRAS